MDFISWHPFLYFLPHLRGKFNKYLDQQPQSWTDTFRSIRHTSELYFVPRALTKCAERKRPRWAECFRRPAADSTSDTCERRDLWWTHVEQLFNTRRQHSRTTHQQLKTIMCCPALFSTFLPSDTNTNRSLEPTPTSPRPCQPILVEPL